MATACDTCAAPCCRKYHVGIDALDAWRIARDLGLPMADFATLDVSDAPDHEFRTILIGDLPSERRRYYCLSLRKVPDTTGYGGERCVFLVSVGMRGRCGIYPTRPLVCRVYPTLDAPGGVIDTDGGGRFCPPNSWTVGGIDAGAFRRHWAQHRASRGVHQDLVDGWNERVVTFGEVRTEAEFFAWIDDVCDAMAREAPAFVRGDVAGWDKARATALVDGVLRAMGWRTDETVGALFPRMVDRQDTRPVALRIVGQPDVELILDEDEPLDPWGDALAKRLLRP